jgi:hypothetical protein
MRYVVARGRQDIYEMLQREFAAEPEVEVLLDQRRAERRREDRPAARERRGADRRSRVDVDLNLRTLGWAILDPS